MFARSNPYKCVAKTAAVVPTKLRIRDSRNLIKMKYACMKASASALKDAFESTLIESNHTAS